MDYSPPRELLLALQNHSAFDSHEANMRDCIREFLLSLPDPVAAFGRDLAGKAPLWGHLTASAWIVDQAGENVVLLHHRKLGKWLQPGGHLENETHLATAAVREAMEETGLQLNLENGEIFDVDVHQIPEYWNTPPHYHYDVRFLLRGNLAQTPVTSNESREVKWCDLNQAMELSQSEESIARLIRKTRSLAGKAS